MNLIFATNNQHKVEEIRSALPDGFEVTTLKEAGIDIDIPEPHNTLQANAEEKARVIYKQTGSDCFSEDTGLEVFELNNEPGVKSARYAGDEKSPEKNIEKLLLRLGSSENRKAQFRTVICLILDRQTHFFEGICKGVISFEPKGMGGFGYDSVFTPEGAQKTFAEMAMDEKNRFSHRKKALDLLVTFLNSIDRNK